MRASGKRGEGAMTIDLGDRGWDRLDGEAIGAVEAVIAVADSTSDYVRREFRQTDICAYPDDDTIVWSVSVGPGNVIAEGVRLRASSAHIASAEQLQAENGPALNSRELATVLAALRFWRREQLMSTGGEHAVASAGGRFPQLTAGEIDALCERLNVAQTALFQTAATSDTTPGRAEKTRPAEDQFEEPSEAAMAAWEEVERHAFACTTIPLWPDVDLDDPAERRSPSTQWALRHNANVSWANQLGMARDEAEFHQIFSSLQSDPAVDTVAARHIAYALTGDPHLQHVSREAAIGAMESYFYQQHEQAHQEQRQSQGGAAR